MIRADQLHWHIFIFVHDDCNDDEEISKQKNPMNVKITQQNIKIGQWQVDDNDQYHKNQSIKYHTSSCAHLCKGAQEGSRGCWQDRGDGRDKLYQPIGTPESCFKFHKHLFWFGEIEAFIYIRDTYRNRHTHTETHIRGPWADHFLIAKNLYLLTSEEKKNTLLVITLFVSLNLFMFIY